MKKYLLWLCLLSFSSIVFAQNAADYKTISNLSYRPQATDVYMKERCVLDIYYPVNKPHFATLVWFHGGGLTGGQKYIPQELLNQGFAVVAVNYRLSPKVKAPAYIEDAAAAVAWTFKHIAAYGGDTSLIFVAGHSAGGYLTSMLGLDKAWLAADGVDADHVAAWFPFSGQAIEHFTIRHEQGISDKQPIVNHYAPLYHVRPNLPPFIIITGDRKSDMPARYIENAYLYEMLLINGDKNAELHELKGFDHGSMVGPACHIVADRIKEITAEKRPQ